MTLISLAKIFTTEIALATIITVITQIALFIRANNLKKLNDHYDRIYPVLTLINRKNNNHNKNSNYF